MNRVNYQQKRLGIYHNLAEIYNDINLRYFANAISAQINWGIHKQGARAKRSIRLGSYAPVEKKITIHPALDQAFVPKLAVAKIIFHEMLHQKHGVKVGSDGRRRIHTKEFRLDEAQFESASLIENWFKQNITQILNFGKTSRNSLNRY